MVGFAQTADACGDEPEEGRVVLGAVEEVGEVESQEGEVVCCVDAGVDVPQEPFVVVHQPLFDGSVRWQPVAVVAGTQERCLRDMDVVALVQLALEVRQADHDGQVLPHIARPEF